MTENPQGPFSSSPPPAEPPVSVPAVPVGTGKNGIALAGMILGIICVATSWIWCFLWASIICGVVGLILSIIGKKKARETGVGVGKAKAGLICSIVGLAIAAVVAIIIAIAVARTGPTFMEEFRKAQQTAEETNRLPQ